MCEGKMQYDMLCMYICLTYDDYNSCYAQSKSVKRFNILLSPNKPNFQKEQSKKGLCVVGTAYIYINN